MSETNVTVCTCLEVFGENPECPKHGTDALEARISDLEALIAAQHGDVVSRTAKLLYEKDDIIASLRARLTASEAAREKLTATLEDIANDRPLDLKAFARAALNTSEARYG